MATQAFLFILWVVVVLGFVVDIVDLVCFDVVDVVVDVDVVDLFLRRNIVNICLRKPRDGEILVQHHGADKVVLEEYSAAVFDTNFTTGVADVSAAPVERAVVLNAPHHALVAVRVEVEREEIAVGVWIPMPAIRVDNRLNDRLDHRCSWVVPSHVEVVDVEVVIVVSHI